MGVQQFNKEEYHFNKDYNISSGKLLFKLL